MQRIPEGSFTGRERNVTVPCMHCNKYAIRASQGLRQTPPMGGSGLKEHHSKGRCSRHS